MELQLTDDDLMNTDNLLRTALGGWLRSHHGANATATESVPLKAVAMDLIDEGVCEERARDEIQRVIEYLQLDGARVKREPFQLNDHILDLLKRHAPGAARYFAADRPELCSVNGDARKIKIFLSILVENALKFSQHKTKKLIFLRRALEVGSNVFVLGDNGEGFKQEFASQILSPYFEIPEPSINERGAGLGLATAARIAKLHGGKIWVESRPGEGTRIFFQLSSEEDA